MPGLPKALHEAPDWASLQKKCDEVCAKSNLDKFNKRRLKTSAPLLYKEALEEKKKGDEERFYLFGMKFCTVVKHLGKKYGKSAVQDLLEEYKQMIGFVEELSEKLPMRYESEEIPVMKAELPPTIATPANIPKPVPAVPPPSTEKRDGVNGTTGYNFVSVKQLYDWLNSHLGATGLKESVLIIDVRPSKDYETSHIKSDRSISVPEEIVAEGKSASYYGKKIDPKFQARYGERKFVDRLLLIDWSSTSPDLQKGGPLQVFKRAIDEFDPGAKYLSCHYILDGGFERWNSTYPNASTCPRVEAPSKDMADILDLNAISFPNLSESPKEWPMQSGGIGNGGESTPYAPFSANNQYFQQQTISRPPIVDRSSKANAELCYEKNKQAQLQIEKDIDQSKSVLNHLAHELQGKQTKELLDEKKRWEEKYSDLERQHELKEAENLRLKQEIEDYKHRQRIAAARQAPKPRMAPMTLTDEPTEVPTPDFSAQTRQSKNAGEWPSQLETNNDAVPKIDSSAVQPAQDSDVMLDLKRSRSTPNIPQVANEEIPPTYDRSTKPALLPQGYQTYGYGSGSIHRVHGSNRAGLTGLKNLGNTCYMNSIVQCISNTSKLAEYFCYGRYQEDLNPSRSNPTGGEVARKVAMVIRELWSGEYRSTGCEELKRVVGRHVESFAGTSQQDSHEFLTFLMDWMHNDLCKSPRKKPVNPELLSGPKMAWAEYKKASGSFISELFFVQQVSTVLCSNCHEESVTYEEPTSNLTLQLPSANNRCTLQDCLRLYTTGEPISGYRCESCEQTHDAIKKVDLWRLPQILVIHLKRFYSDGFYHKRQTLVDFPLKGLDMRSFTSNNEATNSTYDLYAVSNHYGTLEGGHYTAFCRNKDKWYKYDDQDVTEIQPGYVRTPNAYILFYEQT